MFSFAIFFEIYMQLFYHKILLVHQLKVDSELLYKKRKEKTNYNMILLATIKMLDTQLCYLSLGWYFL